MIDSATPEGIETIRRLPKNMGGDVRLEAAKDVLDRG